MVRPMMGNSLIGMSLFKKYSITLSLKNSRISFRDMSLQLGPKHGKFKGGAFELKAIQKVLLSPFQHVMVPTIAATELGTSTGNTVATPSFSRKSELVVTPAVSQLEHVDATIQVTKPDAHTLHLHHQPKGYSCQLQNPYARKS